MSTFAQSLREHAAERPLAPALSFEGTTWSFSQLHERSSRVANALKTSGVRPGDRVAVLTKNRAESFELIFACSQIGAILVGLNWRLAPAEIAAIVEDATPSILIFGEEEMRLLNAQALAVAGLARVIKFGAEYDAWRDAQAADDAGHVGAPDDVIFILYTSGTTGLPKGVMLTNEGMSYTRRLAQARRMGPASVNLVAMPMFHIGGFGVIGALHERWIKTPVALVVLKPGSKADAKDLIEFTRERLARYKCPTSVRFVDALPRNAFGKLLKTEMRRRFGGG